MIFKKINIIKTLNQIHIRFRLFKSYSKLNPNETPIKKT